MPVVGREEKEREGLGGVWDYDEGDGAYAGSGISIFKRGYSAKTCYAS